MADAPVPLQTASLAAGPGRRGVVLLTVAVFALVLIGLDGWRIMAARQSEIDDARVNLENMVRLLSEESSATLEATDSVVLSEVTRLESAPITPNLLLRMNKALTAVVGSSSRILVISVYDEHGNWLVNSSAAPPDLSQNFADRAYFQHHRAHPQRELYLSEPLKERATGKWAIMLSRRWNKPDGSFGGVVVAATELEYQQRFFQSLNIGRDGAVALFRADGITLARRPHVEANVGKSVAKGEVFARYLPMAPSGTHRIRALLDGADRLISYQRLPNYPIVATAALSMDEVLARWRSETAINLALLAVLLVLAGLLAWRLEVQLARRASAERATALANLEMQQALRDLGVSEARLRESEHFLASLLDHVPGMVAYWTADLHCAFSNQYYLEWFGKTKEQMRGIAMQDMMGPALFAKNEPMVRAALRGERQMFERTLTKADGSTGYTLAQYIPAMDNGTVRGFLALVSDVSELKLAQLGLERANAELQAANHAKSQFVASVSHEIRTPLNAVLGMVQLLERTPLTAQQLDYVGKTQLAATTLLGLLNDVLDFSKIEAGKMELEVAPFRLDRVLRALAAILANTAGDKSVEVLFDVDQRIPSSLVGDGMRLQQVLLNLTSNAVKFTLHGEVVLALRLLGQMAQQVDIAFTVRDTGIGIAPDQQERIFEGFSQAEVSTTRRFGGTGLGLAISKKLVELMGGSLAVHSVVGQGSEFSFTATFQVGPAQPGEPPEYMARQAAKLASAQPLKALVVDDNATARELLAGMAASFNWHVDQVASAEAALAMARAALDNHAPYGVFLLDWLMPGMDGMQAARQLREMHGHAARPAIILVTANAHSNLQEAIDRAPGVVDRTLTKPTTASMLFDAVVDAGLGSSGQATHPRPRLPRLGGLHLLLAEDNPLNQQVARELLQGEGATVAVAANGQACLDLLVAAPERFDAVLMDVHMPVLDGHAAARAIRGMQPFATLPIIAMTANASLQDRADSAASGMDGHVSKPFNLDELVQLLQSLVARGGRARSAPASATGVPGVADVGATGVVAAGWFAPDVLETARVHGMDLEGALHRFGNNTAAFERAMRYFAADGQAMAGRLEAALADPVALAQQLHSIKGATATLGANQLAELAAQMEAAVRARGLESPQAAAALAAKLREQAGVAAAMVERVQARAPRPPGAPAARPDAAALLGQVRQLRALLQASDLAALTLASQLQAALNEVSHEVAARLQGAISRLDFSAAAGLCDELAATLQEPSHA